MLAPVLYLNIIDFKAALHFTYIKFVLLLKDVYIVPCTDTVILKIL